MDQAYRKILQMIQDGIICAEEAEKLLNALDGEAEPDDHPEAAAVAEQPHSGDLETARTGPPGWWQRVWVYVLAGGVLLLALAGVFTVRIAQGHSRPGWLACTLPLMIFGALVAGLTWWSRTARWLHVKVHDEDQRINISLPLPLRLAAWLLRLIGPWVPQLQDSAVDEAILALAEADTGDEGMLVMEVDDQDSGEQVRISIG